MTPHVERMRAKAEKAAQSYRVATVRRHALRREWVNSVAAMMRAEMNAIRNFSKKGKT